MVLSASGGASMVVSDLKKIIREIPDFPKPGITFYDLTTLFKNGDAFQLSINRLAERFRDDKIDVIVGVEARGFMLAAALAYEYEIGIVPVRKPGKLPWRVTAEDYDLEYGSGRLEIHEDALERGQRVLIVDDVLATGGTAAATARLIGRLGAHVVGFAFLVELKFLNGRERLGSDNVFSLIGYA